MESKTYIQMAITLLLALMLGCSCNREEEPLPEYETDDGMVDLVLKLSINGSGARSFTDTSPEKDPVSRAGNVSFENPVNMWEGVSTLRIIIIRSESNNLVEYNKLITYPANEHLWQTLKEEKFKVTGGEWKRIYLIANEESLSSSLQEQLKNIASNETLTVSMGDLNLSCTPGAPFIDDTGSDKIYLPMSEFFDIMVKEGIPGTTTDEQIETLFVTRSAVKFSFSAEDADDSHPKGLKITNLSISGIGNKEWLFPHNAVYSPEKYEAARTDDGGREMLSFRLPEGSGTFDYAFRPSNFGLKGTEAGADIAESYTPALYFLESGLKEYRLTVTTELEGLRRDYPPVVLPNLPLLPRNTHTRIHIQFKKENIHIQVDLLPYIGVTLDPIFGGDLIVKPPKPREQED